VNGVNFFITNGGVRFRTICCPVPDGPVARRPKARQMMICAGGLNWASSPEAQKIQTHTKIKKIKTMNAKIGITPANLQAVAVELSKLLADEFVLYTKTRNAHWNVEGTDFHSMHIFFEQQYEQLDDTMDSVAERIRQLGHYAPATLQSFLSLTHLTEKLGERNDSPGFIKELLTDHENIIIFLRENINRFANDYGDAGTSDFITGLMEEHEKMAWFLRAHLK
jgi:starvation-inducible DNA-binding protein